MLCVLFPRRNYWRKHTQMCCVLGFIMLCEWIKSDMEIPCMHSDISKNISSTDLVCIVYVFLYWHIICECWNIMHILFVSWFVLIHNLWALPYYLKNVVFCTHLVYILYTLCVYVVVHCVNKINWLFWCWKPV